MLVLPNKTSLIWEKFLKDNKILVYKYIIREIKKGLDSNLPKIELFRSEDSVLKAWINRQDIMKFLDDALPVFVKAEEYEYAAKTKKLMTLYHINDVINKSAES